MKLARIPVVWLVGVVVMLCASALPELVPVARADERPSQPVNEATFDRIGQLRAKLGVDDEALVAMNVSQQQALDILTACRQWCETNSATCRQRELEVVHAQRALRETQRRIRVGPRDQEVIQSLRQRQADLDRARSSYDAYLGDSLGAAIDRLLTAEQRALRPVLAANPDERMPYRAMTLTDEQSRALKTAYRRYRHAIRKAAGAEARQQARQRLDASLERILTYEQQTFAQSWRENTASASARVQEAVHEALPVAVKPEEPRPPSS